MHFYQHVYYSRLVVTFLVSAVQHWSYDSIITYSYKFIYCRYAVCFLQALIFIVSRTPVKHNTYWIHLRHDYAFARITLGSLCLFSRILRLFYGNGKFSSLCASCTHPYCGLLLFSFTVNKHCLILYYYRTDTSLSSF